MDVPSLSISLLLDIKSVVSCLLNNTAMNTTMKTSVPISYGFVTIKKSGRGGRGSDSL